jgi:hypothetical protein
LSKTLYKSSCSLPKTLYGPSSSMCLHVLPLSTVCLLVLLLLQVLALSYPLSIRLLGSIRRPNATASCLSGAAAARGLRPKLIVSPLVVVVRKCRCEVEYITLGMNLKDPSGT